MAERWLILAHEATNSGAPRMLLEVLRGARHLRGPEWGCEMIFVNGGVLLPEFKKLGRVRKLSTDLADGAGFWARARRWLDRRLPIMPWRFGRWAAEWWSRGGGGVIYSNTGTNGRYLAALPYKGIPVVSQVHELAWGLHKFNRPAALAATLARTDLFLGVSDAVKSDLIAMGVDSACIGIGANFMPEMPAEADVNAARLELCRELILPENTRFVTGCGWIDPVKGTDFFVQIAELIVGAEMHPPVFIWLGRSYGSKFAVQISGHAGANLKFLGEVDNPSRYFAASEAVLVTSRVESFSRVAMEAGALGRPVLAFASARGPAEFLDKDSIVVKTEAAAMEESLAVLLADPAEAARRGRVLRNFIADRFTAARWIPEIIRQVESVATTVKVPEAGKPGVVVVTYHPSGDVESRLAAMAAEGSVLIVVDNHSAPEARALLEKLCARRGWELIPNSENLGLGTALNQGVRRLAGLGCEWALLFDQDSVPKAGMSGLMLETWRHHPQRDLVAVVGACFSEPSTGRRHRFLRRHPHVPGLFQKIVPGDVDMPEVSMVITSGSMVRLTDFMAAAGFDEGFFIDYVDTDYCLRCLEQGRMIAVSAEARFEHTLGDRAVSRWCGLEIQPTNHSALRDYYIARNRVAMWGRHAWRLPHWAVFDVATAGLWLFRVLAVETDKLRKLQALAIGTRDGLMGRKGPCPEPCRAYLSSGGASLG